MVLNRYTSGQSMFKHSDGNLKSCSGQFVSIWGKFRGGALRVYQPNGKHADFRCGSFMIDGNLEHEVLELTSGKRYSLITYCKDFARQFTAAEEMQLRAWGFPVPQMGEAKGAPKIPGPYCPECTCPACVMKRTSSSSADERKKLAQACRNMSAKSH